MGDIHGCAHALDAILEAIEPQPTDLFISLGDFIDMGRDTAAVMDRLIEIEQQCEFVALLGNHEEMLPEALTNERLRESWFQHGGIDTINSYRYGGRVEDIPPDHIDFVRRCRPYYETDHHLYVHANFDPNLPLAEQPDHLLRWTLLENEPHEPHVSGKTAIVGHTEQRNGEILDLGCVMGIDTYCHGYGWLTAIDVLSGQVWQASRWGVLRDGDDVQGMKSLAPQLKTERV